MITALAAMVHRRPLPWVVAWLALLLTGLLLLPGILLDPSLEGMLGAADPATVENERLKSTFAHDDLVAVTVEAPDILSEESLGRLADLVTDLEEEVPHLDRISSLLDVPIARVERGRLILERALHPWPEDGDELSVRQARLGGCHACRGYLLDREHTFTLVLLEPPAPPPVGSPAMKPTMAEWNEIMEAVERVLERHRGADFELGYGGKLALTQSLQQELTGNLVTFIAGSMLASLLILLVLFRSLPGVLIPLLAMLSPLSMTLGLMTSRGVPIQLPSSVLPPLIVVISVAGAVHVLTSLNHRLRRGASPHDALMGAFATRSEALALSALTTTAALLAISTSGIEPVSNVGFFGAFATITGLGAVVVVIPAWARWFPGSLVKGASRSSGASFSWLLTRCSRAATSRPRLIVAATLLAVAATGAMALKLEFSHDPVQWLPLDWPVRLGTDRINERLVGTLNLEVLVDSPEGVGVSEVERLRAFQDSIPARVGSVDVGGHISVLDYLADLQEGMQGEVRPYEEGPAGEARLKRDLKLLQLQAPREYAGVVSPDGALRVMLRATLVDAREYTALIEEVRRLAEETAGLSGAVTITGLVPLFHRVVEVLGRTAWTSLALAVALVTLMMAWLVRGPLKGLAVMVPNLMPVTVVLAGMWLLQIPLDIFTLLTISLAVGLVVDDTIHLIAHFRRGVVENGGDARAACHHTLMECGPAIMVTTVVLVAGWSVLLLSEVLTVVMFARLGSAALLLGLVADLLVAPALLVLLYSRSAPRLASGDASALVQPGGDLDLAQEDQRQDLQHHADQVAT